MTKIGVLIPDGESTLTKHVVHCLAQDDAIEIHILSKDPNAFIKHSKFIKSFHVYDSAVIGSVPLPELRDKVMDELITFHYYDAARSEELIAEIKKIVLLTGASIIFPVDEHIVKILSGYKTQLSAFVRTAPLPEKEMFDTAINKWGLAQFLKGRGGVPHPTTIKFSKGEDIIVIDRVKFPVIIKPIDQGNATGIETFEKADDLKSFFENQKLKHEYVVQPLIDGYDIDCSVLCENGRIVAYTIQKGIVSAKVRFRAAVGIEFLYDERVLKTVEKMMLLLNWSGVAHVDLRYDAEADEIKVIEINARYWGSLLGSLNAGVNFPLLAVRTVGGEKIQPQKYHFNQYFMGKAPLKQLVKGLFATGKDKVRLRDTSLFFTLKDPLPVFAETWAKIKSKL